MSIGCSSQFHTFSDLNSDTYGDITVDYPQHVVTKALADLGVWERDDEAPLDDSRWNSGLGKEILECHLLLQFERSGYGSRSKDDI